MTDTFAMVLSEVVGGELRSSRTQREKGGDSIKQMLAREGVDLK